MGIRDDRFLTGDDVGDGYESVLRIVRLMVDNDDRNAECRCCDGGVLYVYARVGSVWFCNDEGGDGFAVVKVGLAELRICFLLVRTVKVVIVTTNLKQVASKGDTG